MYCVYIIYSSVKGGYYIGQTQDVEERLSRHNNGYELYTSSYVPWELKLVVTKARRSEAMVLEKKLKNLSKARIKQFIEKYGRADEGPDVSD